ncbi:MAG: phage major capsid protein [Psychroserpens sp.]|nr:phage major capsid protein [Psychroserpens sp.]
MDLETKANEINEKIDALKSQISEAVTKEDLTELENKMNELDVKDLTEANKTAIEEMQEKINFLHDQATKQKETKKVSLREEIAEKMEDIKGIVKGTVKNVVLKANVLRSSIANNTEAVRLGDIGQLGVKQRSLYDYFTKIQVGSGNHNGTIRYIDWDEGTINRAAASVAEGAQFPESTAAWQEYTKSLIKVGDSIPVSEEFGTDEVLAASEISTFLNVNVNTKIDADLAVGTGGSDIDGLMNQAPAFTASASGITDANIKDLVRKMRTAIVKTRGSKYSPNFVAMNSDTFDQYYLKKDADNNYIFDPVTGQIAGLDVVEDNNLADNTLCVGDGRFGRIYEMGGVTLSEGYVDDQFTGDLKTIKARARLLFLIREVDKTGFLKSTDVATDLATLAS